MLLPLIAGAAVVATWAHATWYRNSPLFGAVLAALPGTTRRVALTFDDGPNAGATPLILDVLRDAGVPATFFMLGAAVDRYPALARRIVDEGHAIGNHGYHHQKLHWRSPAYVRAEIAAGAAAITRACGRAPTLFRAPHGFRNPWVTPIARALGQRTVGWSVGAWDPSCPDAELIAARILRRVRPGSIVLLHDGDGNDLDGDRQQTARALPLIIRQLRQENYAMVPLVA